MRLGDGRRQSTGSELRQAGRHLLHVLQSPFHVECLCVACCVIAGYATGVTMRDYGRDLVRPGQGLAGVQRGAAVARSWFL